MKTKEEALCTMKGIEALLIALSQYTEKMECDPDALFVLSKSLTECREYFEENGMDVEDMSMEELEDASEVFPLPNGQYLSKEKDSLQAVLNLLRE